MADGLEIEWVNSAVSGDIASFGKLCDRYYNAMVAVAYSVLEDHHLAEDAAQEAFARALKNLKQLRSKEKFGFWLGRICRNVAKDTAMSRPRYANSEGLSAIADSCGEEHEDQAVRQAINRLGVCEREVIVLRYYNNMSHAQMAGVLGLSKAAINNRLSRARRKVAKHLQNNGFAEVGL